MHNNEIGIVTRSGERRLRWLAAAVAVPLFGVVAAFGTVERVPEPIPVRIVIEPLALSATPVGDSGTIIYVQEDRFRRSDTLATLIERLGADEDEAATLLRSSRAAQPFRFLLPGTTVQAKVDEVGRLRSLSFLTDRDTLLSVDRLGDSFRRFEQQADVARGIEMKSGEIKTSLFAATDATGIPDAIAVQLADIFGGDVDFHRDLRRGDRFGVVFETFYHGGKTVRFGRVLAAEFYSQRKTYRAVWFQDPWGRGGYYTPDGENLRKVFLRSPLEFSRITSGFGLRRHPIFRQWRAHQGIDYGAPVGTRVKSTGDGVVSFAGRRNGYGNLIVLRHHGGYSTYYAHLRNFASALRAGSRVVQGEIIGYVGQTGWANGPHLHYEFHLHNQNRNPLTMAFPAAQPILAIEQAAFRRTADPVIARLDLLKSGDLALLE
ncbi:MAG TPA: peptidoglycan DD-metalloendopeptidase family protein [Burkholderiales bacterium]|nr:peptidoglycan DD-metalloendopeptidase family protein [Burkholderiales bacterium]